MVSTEPSAPWQPPPLPDVAEAGQALAGWEARLDPADPAAAGLEVLAYGEISATMLVPDPLFTGLVAKRMTGFPDAEAAAGYVDLVRRYCHDLDAAGVAVAPTAVVPVPRTGRAPAVYLLQPHLPAAGLGNVLLRQVDDATLAAMISAALEGVDAALAASGSGVEMAIDGQLSNWWFDPGGTPIESSPPMLIDVGTPFVRRSGEYLLSPRILLSAVPPGVRSWYLWRRVGEAYMDDYFDRRLVALDLVGNFIKEGARARIGTGLDAVNEWLGPDGPVTAEDVQAYYDQDAATLELFLRVRRADRWLRTRLLRRRYDFVLPGAVHRG